MTGESAGECDAVDSCGDGRREGSWTGGAFDSVVNAAEEFGDEGYAEEIVGIGEEAHSGDYHRCEVVELGLCTVKNGEKVELISSHGGGIYGTSEKIIWGLTISTEFDNIYVEKKKGSPSGNWKTRMDSERFKMFI